MRLFLPPHLRAELLAGAAAAQPREACGLIAGAREDGMLLATMLRPSPNRAEGEGSFEIDPAVYAALQRALRGTGSAVIGCYHSHPGGTAAPSPRDRASPGPDGFVWLIVAGEGMAAFAAPDFAPVAVI
jgi:desampylase